MLQTKVQIIIVGAGCGGASAAYHLGRLGYQVALLEKEEGYGPGLMGVNGYFAVGSRYQREKHYMTGPGDVFRYLMQHANWSVDQKIVSDFVNRSAEICHWLTDNGAAIDNIVAYYPGCPHTWIVMPQHNRIYHVLAPVLEQMHNVTLYDRVSVRSLLEEKGCITGVEALDERTGEAWTLSADAVILATGEAQGVMGATLSPYLGMEMAEKVGASTLEPIHTGFPGGPMDGTFRQPCNLFVNLLGKRFTDESIVDQMDEMTLCAATQKGAEYFMILDESIDQWYQTNGWIDYKYGMGDQVATDLFALSHSAPLPGPTGLNERPDMREMLRKDLIVADSLTELAEKTGLPADELCNTVKEYNAMCMGGRDTLFYKRQEYMLPLTTPPYYAVHCKATPTMVRGPIRTNGAMQVLNRALEPIPGLYAIGGVCNPINGTVYTHYCAGSRATFALLGGKIVSEALSKKLALH